MKDSIASSETAGLLVFLLPCYALATMSKHITVPHESGKFQSLNIPAAWKEAAEHVEYQLSNAQYVDAYV
jgi:hypothetical protein